MPRSDVDLEGYGTHVSQDPTTTPPVRKKRSLSGWQESVLLLAVALVLAVGLKVFFVQAFYIPSESMEPQFVKNDRILVQKVSYWGGQGPQRGDIVVFKDPDHWLAEDEAPAPRNPVVKALETVGLYPSGGHLVKRVIGIGGDHVQCCDVAGRITVNGTALDESTYLPKGTKPSETAFDVRVPAGHLWVMGDNRSHSADSRVHTREKTHGFVDDDLVVGKVWALIWPWKHVQLIHRPDTFSAVPVSTSRGPA